MSEFFHKGQTLELNVERMAFGGRGIARTEGFVVFVDGALPGQKVRATVTKAAKRFAEADVDEVLEQTPHWTQPFCLHFGKCGGCQFQDLDYAEQLKWKTEHVGDQLTRIARIEAPKIHPAQASPELRGFRNKMEFAFAGGGSESGPLSLGLHRKGSERIVNIEECHLPSPQCAEIVRHVREFCRRTSIPSYDPRTRRGLWRFLVIRETKTTMQTMVQIITSQAQDGGAIRSLADDLHQRFPALTTVVHSTRKARSAIAHGERQVFRTGDGYVMEQVGDIRYRISADSFFQTNTPAAELLYAAACKAAGLTGTEHVLDLYCGSGGLGLAMAKQAASVTGIETVPAAVRDAEANAKLNEFTNCTFIAGDVLEKLKTLEQKPDVVVTDPPRSGMHPDAAAALLELAPERIVYVSCNPSTLARDIKQLSGDYALTEAWPFDLFPHSPHIECVALLERLKS
ncbi:23S rRNA (uracil(1939)-C(5))-methyltransferase RlmD [Desulfovibrio ferrophilus]|uniref:23S rRNA (Uracil-5-)-methyltransferase RumA n=1 Tax=Desulfovibrio ferrophilus TaxID=241368 RepID=A0A2Z6B2W2_9BACT|nr:23S rRNA (uracil(1939)-C(5))-methyltransferase RlmD [Desulfovibrio ferrophilus]BBD09766.1 23S rRNA (Uracil-5-)-methyltransferase RumA [Desulfovibrio ferrophilus]